MIHRPDPDDPLSKSDALWKLLGQAPARGAGPSFVDDTVRAARLLPAPQAWWKCLAAPVIISPAAAAAVIAVIISLDLGGRMAPPPAAVATRSPAAEEIAELAEYETLDAAAEHLDSFSDNELVSLIGF